MKRLLILSGMLMICISFYGVPVKFLGCTPENGSNISKFEFTLSFDISEAVSDLGEGEWGLGYQGNTDVGRYTKLYEGTQEGIELATVMTSNFNGKSEGWSVGNDKITISFPEGVFPKENQLYTLVITNNFVIYPKDKSVAKAVTALKYEDSPLVLTFTGQLASQDQLTLQFVSIENGNILESIKESRYTFNSAIVAEPGIKAQIKEGDTTVAEAARMTVENENTLIADFGEEIPLSYGHSYSIYLPEGAVALASDATKANKAFSVTVNGTKTYTYSALSTSPTEGEKCLPSKVSITYDIPQNTNIEGGVNQANDKTIKIYKTEVSEEKLVASLYGSFNSSRSGIEWDVSKISFEPSLRYILVRDDGLGSLYDSNNNKLPEWNNEKTVVNFTTPSKEEADVPTLEFGTPYIGEYGVSTAIPVIDGMKATSIPQMEIAIKNMVYTYDGVEYNSITNTPGKDNKGYLYEIKSDGDVLLKEFPLLAVIRDGTYERYGVLHASVAATLYDGKEYRLVIPEGTFTIPNPRLYNYVQNQELTYVFKGSTPTEAQFTACSIEEGAEMSELINVVWTVKGEFNLAENAEAWIHEPQWIHSVPVYSYISNGNTYLTVNCCSQTTGNPIKLSTGKDVSINLPAGILVYPTDESITNKEVVLNIKGKTAAPAVVEPEYVTVKVTLDDIHTTSLEFVKGKSFTLQLGNDDWNVESLYRCYEESGEENDITGRVENGVYTSSPINEDTRFKATLKYKDDVVFSNTTGVAELEQLAVRVFSDGEGIVVEGLQGGEHIIVYSVSGLKYGEHNVPASYDQLQISAPKGQNYIIRIQRGDKVQTANIMH